MNLKSFYIICILATFFTSCNTNRALPVEDNIQLDATVLAVNVVADTIKVPWDLLWGPNDKLWFSEQGGSIYELSSEGGEKKLLLKIPDVWYNRTAGLLGMALYNDKKNPPYLFLAYTSKTGKTITSKLMRYSYIDKKLQNPLLLLQIPGGAGHNGSRIVVSRDRTLFWATGDAQDFDNAQDSTKRNGKILRFNFDGTVPADNPIKNSFVYAWGFRNMQGLVETAGGQLFTSEHGDAIEDEVNLIKPLHNYGWPVIEGIADKDEEKQYALEHGTTAPVRSWTPTIAPSGLEYYNNDQIPEWKNSLLLVNLKDRSLRVLKLNNAGDSIVKEQIFIQQRYGRLRDVCVAPNGDVYLSTSNRDWNPYNHPTPNDDRILKISKTNKAVKKPLTGIVPGDSSGVMHNGKELYKIYCAACHKADGSGAGATFPALKGSPVVNGPNDSLISLYLHGTRNKEKSVQMPSFKFLSEEESLRILNYIRTDWGNNGKTISLEEIQKNSRKNKSKQSTKKKAKK